MKSVLIHIVFLLITLHNGNAQVKDSIPVSNLTFTHIKTIAGSFVYQDVDALGNMYLVTSGNRLVKLNANGDSAGVFNEVRRYGNPTYIDVSNPLRPIVYYRNFSTIVVLDRFLSARNTIELRKQQIFNVKVAANSYDNQVWIFDEQDFKLKKIGDDGRLLQESADLRLVLDVLPSPELIIDRENLVYMYDPEKGFYIFDYYGAWKNVVPLKNWLYPAIIGNMIYGFSGNNLLVYDMKTYNQKTYELPAFISGYQSIRVMNGKLYMLKQGSVDIYSIQ